MTRELIEELITETENERCPSEDESLRFFAELLLFEVAKIVCIECKQLGPSLPTRDPMSRTHTRHGAKGYESVGACRAAHFYLDPLPSVTS